MADISLLNEVSIKLTSKEFTLVSKALSGVLKPREMLEAKKLAVQLLETYEGKLLQRHEVINGALESAAQVYNEEYNKQSE